MDKKKNKKGILELIRGNKKIIVLFLMVVLLVINISVWIHQENVYGKYHSGSKYNFLDPSSILINSEDLIVNFQPLRESLTAKYEQNNEYVISLYFEYLPTGANISINKDEKIWPASLIKIPVAMAIMKKIQEGKWKKENELVILDEDKDNSYGTMYQKSSGTPMTIMDLLRESLVNSDNTAHLVLLRNLEGEEIEDIYNHLGLDDIIEGAKKGSDESSMDNRITAKRYSVFFRSLYNSTYLLPEYSQLFLNILKDAPRDLLGGGIPSNVSFVHKTGIRIDDGVRADAGIVYIPNRPYLLTVMVQKKDGTTIVEDEVSNLLKNISGEIYNYVSKI
ncbi:MAG: class A beta-lactamase-related serine hydrolase [Candidatus Moranbacteria bacterium]|nr:class A beta-lactamase-related serine hydrolase [Candidatus Moranbacteria bacterium]